MAYYSYPDSPVLTLAGVSGVSTGVTKYGVSDDTGLGPNGADKFRTYTVTVTGISAQPVGDNDVRDGLGLNVGGQYTGFDIQVGDFISDAEGVRVYRIISISSKTINSPRSVRLKAQGPGVCFACVIILFPS